MSAIDTGAPEGASQGPSGEGADGPPTPAGAPIGEYVEQERIPRAGPLGQAVAALAPLLLGVAAVAYSLSLGLGSAVNPGPGMWPLIASGVLVLASLWSLAAGRRAGAGNAADAGSGGADGGAERFTRGAAGIAVGLVSLVCYVLALSRVGFEIPTLLVLVFWIKVLGKEPWLLSLVVSLITTGVFYLLFVVLLGVPLPRLALG